MASDREATMELFSNDQTLIPVIAQDAESKQVLMLAWMNRQAWEESIESGYATYYSRSRQRLWRKGEESGHRQKIISIQVDCDADTILLQVEQQGAACHTGFRSCFYRTKEKEEWVVNAPRLVNPDDVYRSL